MNTFTKAFLSLAVVGAVFGTVAFFGFSPFLKTVVQQFGSTAGTGNIQHTATFAFNPTTSTATTSSIENTDAQARVVESAHVACSGTGTSKTAYTGAGLANLIFTMATTSTANPAKLGNTSYVLNQNVSTSSKDTSVASTSISNYAKGNAIRWPAGSYMTISSNATNTAACVVGVQYLQGMGF